MSWRRSRRQRTHQLPGTPDWGALYVRPTRIRRKGIRRAPRDQARPKRALTERHHAVLAVLTAEPQGPTAIGRQVGLTGQQATAVLYTLSSHGLASRQPAHSGWVRSGEER